MPLRELFMLPVTEKEGPLVDLALKRGSFTPKASFSESTIATPEVHSRSEEDDQHHMGD